MANYLAYDDKIVSSSATPAVAEDISYDGTTSGLAADDVQEAIDELAQSIGSAGHVIENPSGTTMTHRDNLQFTGVTVTDDSTNDRTIVAVPTTVSSFTNDANYVTSTEMGTALNDKVDKNGTDRLMTADEGTKLSGIESGAQVNVQADWAQNSSTADDYIKNKPELAAVATSGSYNDLSDTPEQAQADWAQNSSTAVDYIKNKPELATVATSGSYNDLTDTPSIPDPQVQADWAQNSSTAVDYIKNKPELATVATSGSYNDLSDKPIIPEQIQVDWAQNDTTATDYIKNKPELATVATSGSYTDLSDKPTLGTAAAKDVATSGNATTAQVVMGDDTRLTDARNAADVYEWAKASAKPTYTASEVGAIDSSLKGANNGVAELDSAGKVPSSQLPSFVDDVIEAYYYDGKFYEEAAHTTEITGETGKIYVDLPNNTTYRWSGSEYVQIKGDLALGETSSTAYRGDRGKTAYDHSQSAHARVDATKVESSSTNGNIVIDGNETTVYTHPGSGTNPHGTTAADVGLGNVPNVTTNNQTPTFSEASTRANIDSGETLSTIFGKIKKFFSDLKTVAFTGSYNDLTDKPSIPDEQVQADWAQNSSTAVDYIKNKPELATVATSGDYSDLSGTPTLGTAAAKDVATSGNASTAQVVMGDDTRLTDARNAADVYEWAKAATKPTYAYSEITNTPDIPSTAADIAYDNTTSGLTADDLQEAIDELAADTGGHIIEDVSGTDLTQRDTLKFSGYLSATDDSTSGKTVVTDEPTEITWANWQLLTTQEKQGKKWLITGAPDMIATDLDAQFVTYGNSNVKAALDSLNTSVAQAAVLVVTQTSVSALPATINNASITSDMVVMKEILSNPAAQTSTWNVATSNGSLQITGTISGSTDITLYLMKSRS